MLHLRDITLQFLDHLDVEDDLSVLVRGHLYVERALIELIKNKLAVGDAIDIGRLRFRRNQVRSVTKRLSLMRSLN